MQDVAEPQTGALPLMSKSPAEHEEGTYVLLPVLGEPDAAVAVFTDGSYSRWIPERARRALRSRPWELGAHLFGGLALLDVLNVVPGL